MIMAARTADRPSQRRPAGAAPAGAWVEVAAGSRLGARSSVAVVIAVIASSEAAGSTCGTNNSVLRSRLAEQFVPFQTPAQETQNGLVRSEPRSRGPGARRGHRPVTRYGLWS